MRIQEIKQKNQTDARETDASTRARSKASAKGKQMEAESEKIHTDPEGIVTYDENLVVEEYLVSHPVASPLSLVSRVTRGYWAVRARDKAVHFLKMLGVWMWRAWKLKVESCKNWLLKMCQMYRRSYVGATLVL
ncbi:hypothetical protein BDN70DRAFT_599054 [Pholiota conissans]|uniref:Uncharacterized protein n=1 Tax=Pholiota conissans TaxID=109636 RepID=A0A9P6CLZ5_9AGAR|nr:hypothetical protein BDN70DRAFT_599054 [Pholiota conissans]